ncbi:hypothetical protein fugu_018166 [Takifugu bimaculatus]|uniref:Aurora kinase A and ninein-interacting protein n=1 Tax=Takifugu bimaculatus TaxID=433685 RepID=A0A4Z2BKC1_9TELE|nr:hypothetical protein fugu_018166 [Takifugu bimaculatus]
MKTSKPTQKKSDQEKCGVWLDAAELKGKAKQKRLARPISKLLNPFLGGGGYNVAVALNFTQTKLEMPKTRQSSISSYFSPQHKVVKKISTSEEAVTPPASVSNAHSPATRGTKRSREIDLEAKNCDPAWLHTLEGKSVDEAEVWQEQTGNAQNKNNDRHLKMIQSPQSKQRVSINSLLLDEKEPPLRAWSQDPLFTFSECSQGESYLKEQNNITEKDLSPSEAWGAHLDGVATTSTQKSLKHSQPSPLDDDKENMFAPFSSPNKHSTYSSNRKFAPTPYIPVHPQETVDSQFTWTKPRSSPIKRTHLSCKVMDEDSLAMLFTQDSEGFRVMAHRSTQERSPLKDQSNINPGMSRMSSCKSLLEEEEMLFTQDSQGNLVIKH